MAEITLAKALKVKNRLAGRLAKVQADIQAYNSVPEGQADQVNVPALMQTREELVGALVRLKTAIQHCLRRGDDRNGFARGELESTDFGRIYAGDAFGVQCIHHPSGDFVAPAERLRQPPTGDHRPPQIDLLCADATYERGEHVQLADLSHAGKARIQRREHRVFAHQACVVLGRGSEGVGDHLV